MGEPKTLITGITLLISHSIMQENLTQINVRQIFQGNNCDQISLCFNVASQILHYFRFHRQNRIYVFFVTYDRINRISIYNVSYLSFIFEVIEVEPIVESLVEYCIIR